MRRTSWSGTTRLCTPRIERRPGSRARRIARHFRSSSTGAASCAASTRWPAELRLEQELCLLEVAVDITCVHLHDNRVRELAEEAAERVGVLRERHLRAAGIVLEAHLDRESDLRLGALDERPLPVVHLAQCRGPLQPAARDLRRAPRNRAHGSLLAGD